MVGLIAITNIKKIVDDNVTALKIDFFSDEPIGTSLKKSFIKGIQYANSK